MATISSHIAVMTFPFSSHPSALLNLVRRLAASAPTVRFSFLSTAKSNQDIFSGQQYDNIRPYDVSDGLPEGFIFAGNVHEPVEAFMNVIPGNFKAGMQEAEAEAGVKVGCLLTDAFLAFGGEMAEAMGVPWIAFWIGGPCSLSVHLHTDPIRSTVGDIGTAHKAEQTLKFIPGMSKIQICDLPEGIVDHLEMPIAHALHVMGLKLPEATAVVLNSYEEIDLAIITDLKTKLKKVLSVGPSILALSSPPKPDESGCLPWLDKHKVASVAYISFGTILVAPPSELAALAEAIEASRVPYLWSLPDHSRRHLPQGFLERTSIRGLIVSWAPQLQVLAHTSVSIHITHSGWNSVLESISYAVPMICRPFFADNMLNCRMVEDVWEIGVRVEDGILTKSGTMKAIQLLLSDDKGKELKENIMLLQESAVKAVESNGSSAKNFEILEDIIGFYG
ncbi:hypothetical protein RJ639_029377 [Escallonia herrerae]|uniref:Glycosyltransferase n=1 Tax=Escallonia herrerae TaxID=1293975 RepID=A0AA88X5K7_9ASTE|nr:hypothetical protein RJ639_029377 [Escallonia herrerae]